MVVPSPVAVMENVPAVLRSRSCYGAMMVVPSPVAVMVNVPAVLDA
jgi:hypothetical protein